MTVTATRVETDLMKTPVAVSVFDQDTLDQQGVQNVADLAQLVPNMDIATINGQSTPVISMRGVRSTNETELGDPAVGVHLDGIYSPRMQGVLALMFDNERVEVLRGPQGTLFGRNSTVGNINIITAKPKLFANYGRAEAFLGNYNPRNSRAWSTCRFSDKFAMRFAGRIFTSRFLPRRLLGSESVRPAATSRASCRTPEIIAPGSFEDCTSPSATRGPSTRTGGLDNPTSTCRSGNSSPPTRATSTRTPTSGPTGSAPSGSRTTDMTLNFSFQHYPQRQRRRHRSGQLREAARASDL